MIAAYLTAPETLELRETPIPPVPADGLLLRVDACGICGSDLRRWREGPTSGAPGIIPGHEAVGTVVAIGSAQHRFAVGDRLAIAPDIHCGECYYCQRGLNNLCDHLTMIGITPGQPGGLAEYMPLSAAALQRGIVHHVPASLETQHAALSEPLSSVLAIQQKLGVSMTDTVLIIGAGPIGCMHIAVARARGARTIISQRSAPRREMARRFEPDLVIDPQTQDLVAAVRAFTDGRGADVVICANPVAATQAEAVLAVRKGGKVVLFGGLPKADPTTHLDGNRIHYGEIEVLGAFSYHPTMHALALDVLARGLVPASLLITARYPLSQVGAAFEAASQGEALKVLVLPWG